MVWGDSRAALSWPWGRGSSPSSSRPGKVAMVTMRRGDAEGPKSESAHGAHPHPPGQRRAWLRRVAGVTSVSSCSGAGPTGNAAGIRAPHAHAWPWCTCSWHGARGAGHGVSCACAERIRRLPHAMAPWEWPGICAGPGVYRRVRADPDFLTRGYAYAYRSHCQSEVTNSKSLRWLYASPDHGQ